MIKNLPSTLNYHDSIIKYLSFKEQLLKQMSQQDPLSILQSNIFLKYQKQMFNYPHQQLASHIQHTSKTIVSGYSVRNVSKKQMQSTIRVYNVDKMKIGIIEKRPHSCDIDNLCFSSSGSERVWANKIKKIQEQNKIDLMIWSNIMYNHFSSSSKNKAIEEQEKDKQNDISASNKKTFDNQVINNQSLGYSWVSNSQNQTQMLIQKLCERMLSKPSKKNIKEILRQLFVHIDEQNGKTIGLLNKLRKQNDRLQKNVQQNSMKQLQYIVQLKHMEKRIQANEDQIKNMQNTIRLNQQQIRERQGELNQVIRQKLREIQHLQQQNIRRSSIQQLKQKMAIDSIRRTTLCSLSKQRFQIQLKKQELNFNLQCSNNVLNSTLNISPQQEISQETRCDE